MSGANPPDLESSGAIPDSPLDSALAVTDVGSVVSVGSVNDINLPLPQVYLQKFLRTLGFVVRALQQY